MPGVSRLLAAASCAAALALAGCGDSGNPAADALGARSAEDVERLDRFWKRLAGFPRSTADFTRAVRKGDLAVARQELDEMDRMVEWMLAEVPRFERPRLRATLDRYAGSLVDVVDAWDGIVRFYEDPPRFERRAHERYVIREARIAFAAVRREDERLTDRIEAAVPPEDRAEFRRLLEERRRELERRAGEP